MLTVELVQHCNCRFDCCVVDQEQLLQRHYSLTDVSSMVLFRNLSTIRAKAIMESFRVGTLNVHSWADANGKDNRSRLSCFLNAQDLDVLALQEAKPKRRFNAVKELADGLGFPHWICNGKEMAILSKYKIELLSPPSHERVFRRVLYVVLHHNDLAIRIINVHLDYQSESTRKREMTKILATAGKGHPTLLLGDFNAIYQEDYSEEEWEAIGRVRRRNLWELPTSELMASLFAGEWGDCRALAPKRKCLGCLVLVALTRGWITHLQIQGFKQFSVSNRVST